MRPDSTFITEALAEFMAELAKDPERVPMWTKEDEANLVTRARRFCDCAWCSYLRWARSKR